MAILNDGGSASPSTEPQISPIKIGPFGPEPSTGSSPYGDSRQAAISSPAIDNDHDGVPNSIDATPNGGVVSNSQSSPANPTSPNAADSSAMDIFNRAYTASSGLIGGGSFGEIINAIGLLQNAHSKAESEGFNPRNTGIVVENAQNYAAEKILNSLGESATEEEKQKAKEKLAQLGAAGQALTDDVSALPLPSGTNNNNNTPSSGNSPSGAEFAGGGVLPGSGSEGGNNGGSNSTSSPTQTTFKNTDAEIVAASANSINGTEVMADTDLAHGAQGTRTRIKDGSIVSEQWAATDQIAADVSTRTLGLAEILNNNKNASAATLDELAKDAGYGEFSALDWTNLKVLEARNNTATGNIADVDQQAVASAQALLNGGKTGPVPTQPVEYGGQTIAINSDTDTIHGSTVVKEIITGSGDNTTFHNVSGVSAATDQIANATDAKTLAQANILNSGGDTSSFTKADWAALAALEAANNTAAAAASPQALAAQIEAAVNPQQSASAAPAPITQSAGGGQDSSSSSPVPQSVAAGSYDFNTEMAKNHTWNGVTQKWDPIV